MRGITASVTSLALICSGCATSQTMTAWNPMIDTGAGVDQAVYQRDLQQCRAYAEANPEANPEAAAASGARDSALQNGAMGVGAIAAAGLLTGGVALVPLAAAGLFGGALGGMAGAMGGNAAAEGKYRGIVSNCLIGRGYRVIG